MSFFEKAKENMGKDLKIIDKSKALPGREQAIETADVHFVSNAQLKPPYPKATEEIVFGMGCFWGAEKRFWSLKGVYVTAVGYSAGFTPNPTYKEVCTGDTGHTEVVRVVFYPEVLPLKKLFEVFWESHDPTQGMRQGNDLGTQYRSGIYCSDETQKELAEDSKREYGELLQKNGVGEITTEIKLASEFYFAEDYHQQYLAKNPQGYCGLGGCGVKFHS